MSDKREDKSIPRRDFLKVAGLATGAAGAAAVTLSSSSAKASEPVADGKSAGYSETDHVRTYYELARF